MSKHMKVKKLYEDAQVPFKKHASDAGYDLYSYETKILSPGQRATFKTGISIELPKVDPQNIFGVYARVAPRSGLAVKEGVDVLAGVIDYEYRGEILVCLINTGNIEVKIEKGDRLAQLIPTVCIINGFEEVTDLEDTTRSDKGFGSSGKK